MIKKFLISAVVLGTLTACSIKIPDGNDKSQKALDDAKAQVDKDLQDSQNPDAILNRILESGGQPGTLKVAGVLVKNSTLDSRVSVSVHAGRNRKGEEEKLTSNSLPKLTSTPPPEVVLEPDTLPNQILLLSCSESVANEALRNWPSLKIKRFEPTLANDLAAVQSKVVIICGRIDANIFDNINIVADQLILRKAKYNRTIASGTFILWANHLTLLDSNLLQTSSPDSKDAAVSFAGTIDVEIAQSIDGDSNGHLYLQSQGANNR